MEYETNALSLMQWGSELDVVLSYRILFVVKEIIIYRLCRDEKLQGDDSVRLSNSFMQKTLHAMFG